MFPLGDNNNPATLALLNWQSDGSGGVRVPFAASGFGKPLGRALRTPIVDRLKTLMEEWGRGQGPRLVILVGGPGNGKSQAVETLIEDLDSALAAQGRLVEATTDAYRAPGRAAILPASVVSDLSTAGASALRIVQDATHPEGPHGDAGADLCHDIEISLADSKLLQIVCANRGVLARAIQHARRSGSLAAPILTAVSRATSPLSLGEDCWPLQAYPSVACWPMDADSLVEAPATAGDEILVDAADRKRWEQSGCDGCTSSPICPFLTNAKRIRDPEGRAAILRVLADLEIASGQFWNFRDLYTLAAELTVGAKMDYGEKHPCDWVHERRRLMGGSDPAKATRATLDLAYRLQAQAILPYRGTMPPARDLKRLKVASFAAINSWHISRRRRPMTTLRQRLASTRAMAIDPACSSPDEGPLNELEARLDHGFETLQSRLANLNLSDVEKRMLEYLAAAERDLSRAQGTDARVASDARICVRRMAAALCKRRLAMMTGHHAAFARTTDFRASIRKKSQLDWIVPIVLGTGTGDFRASLLTSFRPVISERERLAVIVTSRPPVAIRPAAPAGPRRPPAQASVSVQGARLFLTFETFSALRDLQGGCLEASLPPAVQSGITRLRDAYSGRTAHNRDSAGSYLTHLQVGVPGHDIPAHLLGCPE